MESFQVAKMESVVREIDFFTTGIKGIITLKHENTAIAGSIGHFNEIEMEKFAGIKVENIKPQVDRFVFPGVIILASGRLLNLGCATGHPSLVMSLLIMGDAAYQGPQPCTTRNPTWGSSTVAIDEAVASCPAPVPSPGAASKRHPRRRSGRGEGCLHGGAWRRRRLSTSSTECRRHHHQAVQNVLAPQTRSPAGAGGAWAGR